MKTLRLLPLLILLIGCSSHNSSFDASGTFEATEVTVSCEAMGRIISLPIQEGDILLAGSTVGAIDSTQLYLKRKQLSSSLKGIQSRSVDIIKQLSALQEQLTKAQREHKRVENLVLGGAAGTKQVDDAQAQVDVLTRQIDAQQSTLEKNNNGLSEDAQALAYQIAQMDDQLLKCRITTPITGTVLLKYMEEGELASQGKPLFAIADMENLTLRAFVVSAQLAHIRIGQKVKVKAAFSKDEFKDYEGIVSWISGKAEFTPKTIQTVDERANLVYAIKINIKNDGYLKIGMYGDVNFK